MRTAGLDQVIRQALPEEGRLVLLPCRDSVTNELFTLINFPSGSGPTTEEFEVVSREINFADFRVRGFLVQVASVGVRSNIGLWLDSAQAAGTLDALYSPPLLLPPPAVGWTVGSPFGRVGSANQLGTLYVPGIRLVQELDKSGDVLISGNVRQFTPVTPLPGGPTQVDAVVQVQVVADVLRDIPVESIEVARMLGQAVPGGFSLPEKLAQLLELAQRGQKLEERPRRRKMRRRTP